MTSMRYEQLNEVNFEAHVFWTIACIFPVKTTATTASTAAPSAYSHMTWLELDFSRKFEDLRLDWLALQVTIAEGYLEVNV